MSTENERVEKLMEMAHRAVKKDDYGRALTILREAASLAPLRQDIRDMMSMLLEETHSGSGELIRVRDSREPAAAAPNSEPPARPSRSHAPADFAQSGRTPRPSDRFEWGPPPQRARAAETRNTPNSDIQWPGVETFFGPPDPPETARPRRRVEMEEEPQAAPPARVPRPRPSEPQPLRDRNLDLASKLAEVGEEEEERPAVVRLRRTTPPPAVEPVCGAEEDEPPVPVRRRRPRPAAVEEDEEEDFAPQGWITSRFSRLQSRTVAYASVFAAIVCFVGAASVMSYARFFRAERSPVSGIASAQSAGEASPARISEKDEQILRLGEDYLNRERFDSAIDLLAPVVGKKDSPIHDTATNLLASAHFKKGANLLRHTQENAGRVTAPGEQKKLLDSVANYRRAAELAPENAEYQLHLGNALFYCGTRLGGDKAAGYLDDALAAVTKSIELDRSDARSQETLAWIYESMDKTTQARSAWTKFREMAPTKDDAQKATERLASLSMQK